MSLIRSVHGYAAHVCCALSVASAICQRYIKEILAASVLPSNSVLQRIAIEILTSVARSGFSHPLSISPTLIALTASPESRLANKASATLTLLWQKHSTLLATRFAEPAKVTFEYLMAVHGGANEAVRGGPSAPVWSSRGCNSRVMQDTRVTLPSLALTVGTRQCTQLPESTLLMR